MERSSCCKSSIAMGDINGRQCCGRAKEYVGVEDRL
jgi:hypothetical protein